MALTPAPNTCWAWCDADRLDVSTLDAVEAWIGLGVPASGVAGFRRSHRQAALALQVALAGPTATVAYAGNAVRALAYGGAPAIEELRHAALGDLAATGATATRLRRTTRAWITAGCSATGAARQLGLAERTVRYHLRNAARLRGRAIDVDIAELGAALAFDDTAS
jgi:DNA-binding PucR family transcriptional regulator